MTIPGANYTIHVGDTLAVLPTLATGSVNCCVTSPPYWGLRDYGTATWDGGDPDCDHLGDPFRTKANINANCGTGTDRKNAEGREPFKSACGKCGARRIDAQIGLEESPAAFVAKMVAVFREVRRVLTDDGTCWINLGDSYAASGRGGGGGSFQDDDVGVKVSTTNSRRAPVSGFKPKDLVGIPWRVALALQDDGWILRQDIIWHKPNPMPESVRDRCTKAHEYLFLLVKQPRYYWDRQAMAEPVAASTIARLLQPNLASQRGSDRVPGKTNGPMKAVGGTDTRNRRSVWTVNPKPYKGAHFATYPPDLIRPCILAGCPVGGLVLDPFSGTATTGDVALRSDRRYVGVELNETYALASGQRLARAAAEVASRLPFADHDDPTDPHELEESPT